MKTSLNEQIDRIRQLIEQDKWVQKAASGPQSCGLTGSSGGSNSKEEKQWDKEVKRQDKIDAKDSRKELQDYLNPRIDRLGYKVDKNDFNTKYLQFVKTNPDFETLPSKLTPAQRFGILYKEQSALSKPDYYLTTKLNKMFNRTGTVSMQQFYDLIKQMGGFDKYFELYSKGFPTQ